MPQRQWRGHIGSDLSAARLVRGAALAASVAILPLATACSPDDDGAGADIEQSRKSSPVAAAVAPARVEVIANLTGCKAKIRIEAEQLREGLCHTKQGDYIITTFPEEKYQQTWQARWRRPSPAGRSS
ncbi:hypothetical protein [Streptomyces sp. TRM68367]|uniref:hypothetical protein n=1 Tax=Streptomyces sp. TRM68367 TaxID=2758415 RepID=UPI00165C5F86|nr:hypothetical protein [Streptomyces sp. TRM68367]MBC9730741.1 hypothetical protein [Streptomyces sp. TRM68367]